MSSILHAARANVFLAPVGTVLAVAASILVARCLGPQIYADYATLMAIVSWLLLLGEGGCNIGLGRFMHKASQLGARHSFYKALQLRRWLVMLALVLPLLSLGPEWARTSGLSPTHWTAGIFALIGLLAGAMLHGQLAGSALMATFNHQGALLINQSMTITRALLLGALASTIREPWALVCALLVLATIEALMLHWFAIKIFFKERSVIPSSMLNSAQKHGLVALFDKLTTAFGGGPFLLLVLAGVHSRTELAMLGLATDLLQKALSVIGLPVSNLVLPVLNANRMDLPRFRLQIGRLGGLTTLLFAVAIGGLAAAIPNGLPLLVGASYAAAVPVAMIWLLPLFFEAGVRMVWGAALLTQDRYRWLIGFNLLYGAISLLLVFIMRTQTSLFTLLGMLGVLRLVMSLLLLIYARRLHLLPPESCPLGVMLAAATACVLSLLLQTALDLKPLAALLVGMGSYLLVILALFRWVPLVPQITHEALCQVAGKYRGWLVVLIPQAAKGR